MSGGENSQTYYIRIRGKIHGPFDVEKLQQLKLRGKFSRSHEVSTDRQSWQPASSIDYLFGGNAAIASLAATLPNENLQPQPQSTVPPTGGTKWFYHVGGEQLGPVSLLELRQLVRSGQVMPDDLAWKDGMSDWLPIRNLPDVYVPPVEVRSQNQQYPSGGQMWQPSQDALSRTSGLAVASVTLGILGLFFGLCSVFGIVFGAAAMKDIGRSKGMVTGRGMALSGLILGIIGAVFWALWLLFWFGILTSPAWISN